MPPTHLTLVPSRTEADTARLQIRLLDAALDCYRRLGIAGTTLANIAVRAGVARGDLQRHFDSRDALLQAVVRRELARFWMHIRDGGDGRAPGLWQYLAEVMVRTLREMRAQQNPHLLFLPGLRPVVKQVLVGDAEHLHAFAEWLRLLPAPADTAHWEHGDWLLLSEMFNRLLASYLAEPAAPRTSMADFEKHLRRFFEHLGPRN